MPMSRRLLTSAACAALAILLLFVYLHKGSNSDEEAPSAAPTARVQTVPLERQPIAQTVEAFGIVEPASSFEHTTPASYECIVVAIHAPVGSRVAVGDVIMEIAPSPDGRLQLASARTALKLAAQGLASAQERYDLKLATSQDLLTARQIESDAREKLASYESRGMAGDGKLRAPAAGVVSKLDLLAGSLVTPGSPLFSIASGGKLEARLSVESDPASRLAGTEKVTIASAQQAEPVAVTSNIRLVGRALNPTTGAADVRVSIPASASLLLGEHVRANIEILKKDNALVAPRSAVLPDEGDKQIVYTIKDGKAVRHEVEVGITSGDLVEISSPDLKPGDAVVTLGNYELTDGMSIQGDQP
jgi:membrane fusion protein, multidrug efflux system